MCSHGISRSLRSLANPRGRASERLESFALMDFYNKEEPVSQVKLNRYSFFFASYPVSESAKGKINDLRVCASSCLSLWVVIHQGLLFRHQSGTSQAPVRQQFVDNPSRRLLNYYFLYSSCLRLYICLKEYAG